ncbi:Aldo/keto reductase [Mycena pura]|uniref:Aldo/keto reductase n=1 Tax=Mycena pura TaxID=153505 RepID=A0AAD6Y6U1_9AGAR|nr:Aldo/keto reductase [Mycena pura]
MALKLNNGLFMPSVGVGCWMGLGVASADCYAMVKEALKIGYRHIDTVQIFSICNEESVGLAIRESGVPREDLFITTKLDQCDHGRVSDALNESLAKLGVNYIDLYLIHWPQAVISGSSPSDAPCWFSYLSPGRVLQPSESPTIGDTWRDMEKLLDSGRVRSIGVSNFSEKTLTILLENARIVPAVNQVEIHPLLPQHSLLAFCQARGIILTAYSPVGKNKFSSDPDVVRIADAHGVTGPQVILSWGVQRGTTVIPKTSNHERLRENITLIHLSVEEMLVLNRLHEKPGMHRSICGFHSSDLGGSCFGWTYEQLGWSMVEGGVMAH